jgi:osmotically-inducible protein OsmY
MSDEYLVQHIRDGLVQDARLNELDIQVVVAGKRIFVTGHVATPERHTLISSVVSELAPDYEICNETTVSLPAAEPDVETLG